MYTTFRNTPLFRYIALTVLTAFGLFPVTPSFSQVSITMPPPGQMIHITRHFEPPQMVGLKIDLKNPFSFDFIMDQGQNPMSDESKKQEFNKIIKYFLVSLAMPNRDMWVNLSPFESNRIIPEVFAQTEMGRDLLSQDYTLKQFTASLMYPENGLGRKFWDSVYAQAQARFGTTEINVNTFNKVWIVADHADVYQKDDTAFLVGSHLKVMLEQDYMAITNNKEQFGQEQPTANAIEDAKTKMASDLVRQIIIPAIEKEVNEGQSFAAVRQVYNAEIMATWFKKTLRQSLLGQVFADKSRIAGQRVNDPQAMEKIYHQYLMAYQLGVFDYIRKDVTPDGQMIPRKYYSGGMKNVSEESVRNITFADLQRTPVSQPTPSDLLNAVAQGNSSSPAMVTAALINELEHPNQQPNSNDIQQLAGELSAKAQQPGAPALKDIAIAEMLQRGIDVTKPIPQSQAVKVMEEIPALPGVGHDTNFTMALETQFTPSREVAQKVAEIGSFEANEEKFANENRLNVANVSFTGTTARPETIVRTPGTRALLSLITINNIATLLRQRGVPSNSITPAALIISNLIVNSGGDVRNNERIVLQLTSLGVPAATARQFSQGIVPSRVLNLQEKSAVSDAAIQRFLIEKNVQAKDIREATAAFRVLVNEAGKQTLRAQAAAGVLTRLGVQVQVVHQLSLGVVVIPKARIEMHRSDLVALPTPVIEKFLGDQGVQASQLKEAVNALRTLITAAGVPTPATHMDAQTLTAAGVAPAIIEQLVRGQMPARLNDLGGINLSDETLTMNVKVDGSGMPLSAQYQDKAMLNISGLTSVIHKITPLTPQNVPALYNLLK